MEYLNSEINKRLTRSSTSGAGSKSVPSVKIRTPLQSVSNKAKGIVTESGSESAIPRIWPVSKTHKHKQEMFRTNQLHGHAYS